MNIKPLFRRGAMLINPERFRPKLGRIIVTQNCPLRCQMCTFWHQRSPDPGLKLIKHWIKEYADFGIEDISLGGGEPFIRKDLVEIVREIKSYGMTCGITTSGWLWGKVPFPPVDRCEISIDGARPETHDKIRGVNGSWERAINAVKGIKEQGLCSIPQLNFVLQPDNYHEMVDFCVLAKSLGVNVSIIPVSLKLAAQPSLSDDFANFDVNLLKFEVERAMKVGNIVTSKAFLNMALSKLNGENNRQRCLAPFIEILIFANGDVYPCGNFDIPNGNLSEDKNLEDIYRDYKPVRREVRLGLHDYCNNNCVYPDIIAGDLKSNIKLLAERVFGR